MATYKHLRSSTANKRPTTSITDGQLAINTNTASPGLFFKDSAGTGIVKVGPVHVGTTAPNATPAAGGSSGNYLGEQWLDTSVSPAQMKVWNGSAWVGIVADELPVSKLQDGDARQLLQTDAAGTGVEWTSNVDVPGTLDVTGATTLDSTLTVPLGSAASPTLRFSGDANSGLYSPGADQVAVATNGAQRITVDASGRLLVGTSTARSDFFAAAPDIQLERTADRARLMLCSNSNSVQASELILSKTRGTTAGSATVVQQNDELGNIHFAGTDGTDFALGASIKANVDGTPGANDMPGRLVFFTTADGANSPTERLRIDSAGRVGIGTSSPTSGRLHVAQPNSDATPNAIYAQLTGATYPGTADTSAGKFVNDSLVGNIYGIWAETTSVGYGTPYAGYFKSAGYIYGNSYGIYAENTHPNVGGGGTAYAGYFKALSAGTGSAGVIYGLRVENTAAVGGTSYGALISTVAGPSTVIPFRVDHAGSERARIDSSGRLLVGTSTARSRFQVSTGFGNVTPVHQFEFNSQTYNGLSITHNAGANTYPAVLAFGKSRGSSAGSYTAVASGDGLGWLDFYGADGTNMVRAATISAEVDGTPGANDMPGRLVFSTTADGASSPTEQLRITSDRYVRLAAGTGGIQFNGDTAATNALDDYEEGTFTPVIIGSTTTGTATYSSQNGKYTKVGNRVFWEIYIDWTGGTGTGNLRVSGLPFTISIALATYPAASIAYVYNVTTSAGHQLTALQASGDTYVYFYQIPSGGGVNVLLDYDASGTMSLSGNYNVA